MFGNKKNITPALAGLVQALATMIYVLLISAWMWNMDKLDFPQVGFLGVAMMLFLLVFSAAMCGLLVFGYPIILALDKKIKEALKVLGYTFLYSVLLIITVVLIIFV